eukprot:403340400
MKCDQEAGDHAIFKIIPPPGFKARKAGYDNLDLMVKKPIEQNVHGSKGVYELVYFMKESKSLERFKKQAMEFDKLINGKSDDEIEKLFWRTLKHSAPVYGADILGSLFDKGIDWNLSEIQSVLTQGLGQHTIQGVNTPYIYVGSWKTMFGWHKEDMDLQSINFIHYGKPKQWYGVNVSDNERFEQFVRMRFPEYFKDCPEYIRHKTTLINPQVLSDYGVHVTKLVHREGEYMVTRASGYHSGFNHGYNIAEAVNFALPRWLDIARNVSACKCVKDSVSFNMGNFLLNFERSEFLKKLQNNHKMTRNRVVEFDETLKRYGLSENLHSFKNTPTNIKILPNDQPKRSNSFMNVCKFVKVQKVSDNPMIEARSNSKIKQHKYQKLFYGKRSLVCQKCGKPRKIPSTHPDLNENNFECLMLNNKIIKCVSNPDNKRKRDQKYEKKKDSRPLLATQSQQTINSQKPKQIDSATQSKDQGVRRRRGQPATPRQKNNSQVSQKTRR